MSIKERRILFNFKPTAAESRTSQALVKNISSNRVAKLIALHVSVEPLFKEPQKAARSWHRRRGGAHYMVEVAAAECVCVCLLAASRESVSATPPVRREA